MIDNDVLLFMYSSARSQVTPIADALRSAWPGTFLAEHYSQVRVSITEGVATATAGSRVVTPALVLSRILLPPSGPAVARSLEMLGSRVVNTTASAALADDKWQSALVLAAAGLRVPNQELLSSAGGSISGDGLNHLRWPLVLKENAGFGGSGVWLVANIDELNAITRTQTPHRYYLAQQFQADAAGVDVRALVIDGQVVSAVERRSTNGDFRSNVTLGGRATLVTLTAEEADMSVRAAAAVGLTIAGVDLLRTGTGPMITEVNGSPGLAFMDKLTPGGVVYDSLVAAVTSALSASYR